MGSWRDNCLKLSEMRRVAIFTKHHQVIFYFPSGYIWIAALQQKSGKAKLVVKPLCFYCQPRFLQSLMCDISEVSTPHALLYQPAHKIQLCWKNSSVRMIIAGVLHENMHQFEMAPILNEPVALQCLHHSPLTEAFQRHTGGREQSRAQVSFLHGFCGARRDRWRSCAPYVFTPPSCNLLNRSSTNTSSLWSHSYPLMFYSLIVTIFQAAPVEDSKKWEHCRSSCLHLCKGKLTSPGSHLDVLPNCLICKDMWKSAMITHSMYYI